MKQHGPCIALVGTLILVQSLVSGAEQTQSSSLPREQGRNQRPADSPTHGSPLILRPPMLVDNIDELAGQSVRILNARVVGLFEPRAFLIESATRYRQMPGRRDRILVLIDGGALRVPAETIVASTVTVLGTARTLLGVRVTAEVPWPAKLDPEAVQHLEVRAAVLATSVRTGEGVELTDRIPDSAASR